MHVIVNHLRFREPIPDSLGAELRTGLQLAGGTERSLGEVIAAVP